MREVLLINGSPHPKGCTHTALAEISATLDAEGIPNRELWLGNKAIRPCIACYACRDSGHCIFNEDKVNEAIELATNASGIIVGSPVYYAGPNGALTSFLDRMFFFKSARYAYKPAAAVVSCRRGGASSSFDRLNKYFTIANMPVVSSQYWNAVHGTTPEEVKQDLEGLQIMRTLARNMAWLIKCIELSGVKPPEPEAPERTNFIR